MVILCNDIILLIYEYSRFCSKLKFCHMCRSLMNKLIITSFNNLPYELERRINDAILLNYPDLTGLDIMNNANVTNINHLTKLIILNVSGICGVDNKGIMNCTNVEKLRVNYNPKITDVNHMTKLTS